MNPLRWQRETLIELGELNLFIFIRRLLSFETFGTMLMNRSTSPKFICHSTWPQHYSTHDGHFTTPHGRRLNNHAQHDSASLLNPEPSTQTCTYSNLDCYQLTYRTEQCFKVSSGNRRATTVVQQSILRANHIRRTFFFVYYVSFSFCFFRIL